MVGCKAKIAIHLLQVSSGLTMKVVRSPTIFQAYYLLCITGLTHMGTRIWKLNKMIMNSIMILIRQNFKFLKDSTFLTMMMTMFFLLVMITIKVMTNAFMHNL